ncbi:ATP-grasp domain-containing protein [Amycolatopsis pigmentata]|uniref:Acetyl-CoA carboxylase biotin carboxylase subunit family protein n=1 Tax=Amycolatopsis pigmentata TaxID=450801 RepID=A0ABW5FWY7_9PSEU
MLVVVYDTGSLSPRRLAEIAAENDCELCFVAAASDHTAEMEPVLRMFGTVVEGDAMPERELVRLLGGMRPRGVVTFSESQIRRTARLADALGLPGIDPADVTAITTKDGQRHRFADAGLDATRYRAVSRVDEIDQAIKFVGLPAVVKPAVGTSSRNTLPVFTHEASRAAMRGLLLADSGASREPVVVLEELIVGRPVAEPWGDYLAVDCLANGSDVRPVFVTSKFAVAEPFRERGGYGPGSVVPAADVREACDVACRAVRALNIRHGIADVELKLTTSGPRLIEVNARLGGWVDDLAMRSGHADVAGIAVGAALGRDVDIPDAVEPKADGVAFYCTLIPPLWATRVGTVSAGSKLRRIANVDSVTVIARPGSEIDWRRGTRSNVASVRGCAKSFADLAVTLAQIEDCDWIEYR